MARVRVVSNRIHLASGVVRERGEELVGPADALGDLVRAGSAEWVEGGPVEAKPVPTASTGTVEAVQFASATASDLAESEGLTAADFAGITASGKTGYTKADVEAALQAQG